MDAQDYQKGRQEYAVSLRKERMDEFKKTKRAIMSLSQDINDPA